LGGSHYTTRAGPSRRRVPLFFPYLHKTTSLHRRVPCSPRSQIQVRSKSIASILQFLKFLQVLNFCAIESRIQTGFPRRSAACARRWAPVGPRSSSEWCPWTPPRSQSFSSLVPPPLIQPAHPVHLTVQQLSAGAHVQRWPGAVSAASGRVAPSALPIC
jgi:hypothetical protein